MLARLFFTNRQMHRQGGCFLVVAGLLMSICLYVLNAVYATFVNYYDLQTEHVVPAGGFYSYRRYRTGQSRSTTCSSRMECISLPIVLHDFLNYYDICVSWCVVAFFLRGIVSTVPDIGILPWGGNLPLYSPASMLSRRPSSPYEAARAGISARL